MIAAGRTIVIAGGGAIGLSIARALSHPTNEIVVLEKNLAIGLEGSSRSSEVVHAGMYYHHASLKREACLGGKKLLYDYMDKHNIQYKKCGKIIVAVDDKEAGLLQEIYDKAVRNGVDDLRVLSAEDIRVLEPNIRGVKGILSPSTGIFDSGSYVRQLLADAEGSIVYNCSATSVGIQKEGDGNNSKKKFIVETTQGAVQCDVFINATGAHALSLASAVEGYPLNLLPLQYYAKGSYFKLSASRKSSPCQGGEGGLFNHLIYPLPSDGGLGVHATIDLSGNIRFGPDVEWLQASEGDYVHEHGLGGLDTSTLYRVDESRASAFYDSIRKYYPALEDGSLVADYAGIRPKLIGPHGSTALITDYTKYSRKLRVEESSAGAAYSDFIIDGPQSHGIDGLYGLFGIESPGLTSSMYLGDLVAKMVNMRTKR